MKGGGASWDKDTRLFEAEDIPFFAEGDELVGLQLRTRVVTAR